MLGWSAINQTKYNCNKVKFAVRLGRLNIDSISDGMHSNKGKYRTFHIGKIETNFDMDLTFIGKEENEDTDNEKNDDYKTEN